VIASGWSPRWSPDGTKIVFRDGEDNLKTIDPDGTDEQIIFTPKESNRGWYSVDRPRWSPDGNHISYHLHFFDNHKWTHKFWIYRVDVNGDRALSMTNDLPADKTKLNVGWR
jgi:Tol biopolymer transport system component